MPRRVQLFIAMSLDGYIAVPGEIDWLFTDQDYGYSDFIAGIDIIVMGRKSYEQTLEFPEWPFNNSESWFLLIKLIKFINLIKPQDLHRNWSQSQ